MKEQQNLVRLLDLDSDFIIDLRYATADNFTKMWYILHRNVILTGIRANS